MATAQLHDISDLLRKKISRHVKLYALGNSNRSMRDIAVDLINQSNLDHQTIAEGCFLCTQTIRKLAEDITEHPHTETLERIFRFFNFKVQLHEEALQSSYQNKPKDL